MNTTVIGTVAILIILVGFIFMKKYTEQPTSTSGENAEMNSSFEISPEALVQKIEKQEDIILLDVRTKDEYADVHLENAHLLPVQELSQESLAQIGLGNDMKDAEIIIYCRSGNRSKMAYDTMESLGYTNIKSLTGGMTYWQSRGYSHTEQNN